MSLLALILALVAVGVILWAINAFVPMDPKIKNILNIVVIIVLVMFLLKVFGVWAYISTIKV